MAGAEDGDRTTGRRGDPVGLSRPRIVAAAVEFIDEHGLRALTMRRLGASLGVEGMALYRYVGSRDGLLDLVTDEVVGQLTADLDDGISARAGWQDYLQRLAHGVRGIALAHPEVFPLIASRPPAAPWIVPPLRSLDIVEHFLGTLTRDGFTGEAAVAAYRAYSSFLLGHLLLEVAKEGAQVSELDDPEGDPEAAAAEAADLSSHPRLQQLQTLLSLDRSAEEFEDSLESLLERLDRICREGQDGGPLAP